VQHLARLPEGVIRQQQRTQVRGELDIGGTTAELIDEVLDLAQWFDPGEPRWTMVGNQAPDIAIRDDQREQVDALHRVQHRLSIGAPGERHLRCHAQPFAQPGDLIGHAAVVEGRGWPWPRQRVLHGSPLPLVEGHGGSLDLTAAGERDEQQLIRGAPLFQHPRSELDHGLRAANALGSIDALPRPELGAHQVALIELDPGPEGRDVDLVVSID
jgi:hypothetical protein